MPKIDKTVLTKEEWLTIKEERRAKKNKITNSDHVNILCLKFGNKYNANYVNILYNMVSKNLTLPFKFYCMTENPAGLNSNIVPLRLPNIPVDGWWFKPYIFCKDVNIAGTILYLDLDIVITGNINKLFTFSNSQPCIIRDFSRVMRPSWPKFNSSVIRFTHGQFHHIWEKFRNYHKEIKRKYFGDQDFLYAEAKDNFTIYPDSWIQSWKWEIRKNKQFAPGGIKGNKKFLYIEDVRPAADCCIVVFHGDPNPHNCDDPYIKEKWK